MNISIKDLIYLEKKNNWAKKALDFDIRKLESMLVNNSEKFWINLGEKRALNTFHQAATKVPAYRDFLKKNKIDHKKVLNIKDFSKVPITNKKNYINVYSLKHRCFDGNLNSSKSIALSSGTSSEPIFWPRGSFEEFESTITHELIYKSLFKIDKYRTLLIIAFPMGIYVSGVATLIPSWIVSQKYNLTIAPVGTNRNDFIKVILSLIDDYEQIIIAGHPFFVKDIVEEIRENNVIFKKRIKVMFCSEGFSEKWREYLLNIINIKNDTFPIVSTYGTSEFLLIGHETSSSIKLKQKIEENKTFRKKILNGNFCAGIFQYNPLFRYIESIKNELVFTVSSGIPLIRYNIHDTGQIISIKEAINDFDIKKIKWKLPFLALGNRSDNTIIFYAANIYPDHIKQALEEKDILKISTGRFVMRKFYTKNMEEKLEINIELSKKERPNKYLTHLFQNKIIEKLKEINVEYLFLFNNLKQDIKPVVRLWSYQDEKFFRTSLKPKYIID